MAWVSHFQAPCQRKRNNKQGRGGSRKPCGSAFLAQLQMFSLPFTQKQTQTDTDRQREKTFSWVAFAQRC